MWGPGLLFLSSSFRPLAAWPYRTREVRSVSVSLLTPPFPRESLLPARALAPGWDRFPWRSQPSASLPCRLASALEGKCRSGEKKVDTLQKEKRRLELELEAVSRKTHDASGQLVLISQELLRKER